MQQGLQNALWTLGGVPEVVRSDNTAAATHELRSSRGRALNDNYAALLDHYSLRSTRINPGQSHENGVAEHAHYRLKDAIDQALILRSRDFDTADDYASFVRQMVERRNRLVQGKLEQELLCLGSLPPAPVPEYVNYQSKVRKWCTIQVAGHSYSVPSRLIGKEVQIRLYADWVEVYYQGHLVERMERVRGEGEANVNYRHVIGSLVRKPGAFARYRFRAQLFPTMHFRLTYDALREWRGERTWSNPAPRPPWQPRWTARCRCCWRRVSPSTTRRCGTLPEAPLLTLSGQPDLKIYDRLLTVSLAAAVRMTDTSVMQDRRPVVRPIQAAHHGRPVGGSFYTAMPWQLSWRYWSMRIAATGASTGCAGSPGCPLGNLRAVPLALRGPLAQGSFVERGINVLAFGLPGTGKTHALCALGHRLVEAGHSVLFAPAYRLAQELLAAKRDLDLPRQLRKLDNFDFLLLDDLGCLPQGAEESEVLFTLIAERYERRSLGSNLVFSEWERIFANPMATAAAIDRVVLVILEFDVPSYRTNAAQHGARPGEPAKLIDANRQI